MRRSIFLLIFAALLAEGTTFDGISTTELSTSTSSTMTSTMTSTTRETTTTRATSLFQSLSTLGSTSHPTQSSPVFSTGSKLQSFSTTPLTSTTSFFYRSSTTSTTGSLPSTTTYRIATSPARAYRGGFITERKFSNAFRRNEFHFWQNRGFQSYVGFETSSPDDRIDDEMMDFKIEKEKLSEEAVGVFKHVENMEVLFIITWIVAMITFIFVLSLKIKSQKKNAQKKTEKKNKEKKTDKKIDIDV